MVSGMSLTHVQLLSVPVADQDRAKDFYVGTLGFELVADTPMEPGRRWVQVRPKGSQTSIALVTWFETMPPGSLKGLVIETDDLPGDVDRITAAGATIDGGVQDAPWGRFAVLHDPDGNGLILQATANA
jgi:catechol 2,3-dioxygenase-like lactoylglutathione lyase family enzyme